MISLTDEPPIPLYGDPNEIYSEDDLFSKLGLDRNQKIADWYFHYPNCLKAVQESKGGYLRDSIAQLESTIRQLKQKGEKVNLAIIFMERLGREKQLYEIDKNADNTLKQKSGKEMKVEGVSIHLFVRADVREIRARGRL